MPKCSLSSGDDSQSSSSKPSSEGYLPDHPHRSTTWHAPISRCSISAALIFHSGHQRKHNAACECSPTTTHRPFPRSEHSLYFSLHGTQEECCKSGDARACSSLGNTLKYPSYLLSPPHSKRRSVSISSNFPFFPLQRQDQSGENATNEPPLPMLPEMTPKVQLPCDAHLV